jgi:hypothetical protein
MDERRVEVRFPVGERDFHLLHNINTCPGVHLASYIKAPGVVSQGVKRQGREAGHSPPSSAERMVELHLHTAYVFTAWCLIN